jgi:hypothetical protein
MSEIKQASLIPFEMHTEPILSDPSANPFKLVVDPVMRMKLRKALFDLIENHDQEMSKYVADGKLSLDSYKEYIEIFARSLRETLHSTEGVAYLLEACGFRVDAAQINLLPETRWKKAKKREAATTEPG